MTGRYIWWDIFGCEGGDDANDGLDPDRMVLTWERVLEIGNDGPETEPQDVVFVVGDGA